MAGTMTSSGIPSIRFGAGSFDSLAEIIRGFGSSVLIVTGANSFESSGGKERLSGALEAEGVTLHYLPVYGEPSPEYIDDAVRQFTSSGIVVVCAVGGGSVIDAGKAISAMLPCGGSVLDYLEGVGTGKRHDGVKVPFIAVPTTAGTGSEATKNAVLSHVGPDGFKKSLRHDNFVPDIAVVDPELMVSCPASVTAASGMDAFSQLLESYVSTKANLMTNALAESGLVRAADNLVLACTEGSNDVDVRAGMAFAALMSGITLANAGLGVVHGFASAIGGLFIIPHGVVCGTLLAPSVAITIERLKEHKPESVALDKYARVGGLVSGEESASNDRRNELLVRKLEEWTETLAIPRLGEYGIKADDFDDIIDLTGLKNNPVELGYGDLRRILASRL